MAAQDSIDFTWLIYFDKDSLAQFRQRIKVARGIVPFEPRYDGLFDSGIAVDDVRKRLDPARPRVVTARLDNDDAVARDFFRGSAIMSGRCPMVRRSVSRAAWPGETGGFTGTAIPPIRPPSLVERRLPFGIAAAIER